MKQNNLIGETFGRLTVIAVYSRDKKQNLLWLCSCVCGGASVAPAYDLRSGKVVSCGCRVREGTHTIHGMARAGKKRSKEYAIWSAMVSRCTNEKNRNWFRYGGRDITVSDSWKVFENFYADMGKKPNGKTLDRIDNNKGYSKENCKWNFVHEQNRNKRSNVWVHIDGIPFILADALKKTGCCLGKLHYRMKKYNITHQEALDLWQQQKKI